MELTKVALVTGAGSGIGRAAAIGLASAGWALVLAGRRADALASVAADITAAGGQVLPVATDVSDEAAVAGLFATTAQKFGRLDLLFNNAGTGAPPASLEEVKIAVWRHVLEVNLTGSFLCTQQAFKLMKAQTPQGGRIINNGSISAHAPRPGSAAYTASKHALTGLTKTTALDGRAYNIACGQIDIGNAASEMGLALGRGATQPDGRVIPEPVMDLDAVTGAILYMAALPLTANVQFMTVMATKMPFIGRG